MHMRISFFMKLLFEKADSQQYTYACIELATKKRIRHACTRQKACRTKLININSPAASVYFVVVWKHFQCTINYPMSGFYNTLQLRKLSRATCGPRSFCFEAWHKPSCTYFIYESSVAWETKLQNPINQMKFRGSCFSITYNNAFCFSMLKILRSVHGQPPVLKHYLCPNATSQGFANVSGKSPVTKSKFLHVWSLSGSYADIAFLPFLIKTTWNDIIIYHLCRSTPIE